MRYERMPSEPTKERRVPRNELAVVLYNLMRNHVKFSFRSYFLSIRSLYDGSSDDHLAFRRYRS
ncbi:hypothetical protein E5Q_05193 [Mixia osmundae IAM 14324]|uniref:Uncharacterized protein n=1 Tax=Mixia osmundae (strain CBS 9802 / IAM 14324 / JCM 22182 / KY 12970) TaxID=764103 RepID=G7E6P7_MIXOS|nr:hypothetical protein E5Q_05193 [Mixia osmundae IAM 14324]